MSRYKTPTITARPARQIVPPKGYRGPAITLFELLKVHRSKDTYRAIAKRRGTTITALRRTRKALTRD